MEKVFTLEEIAEAWKVNTMTIFRLVKKGELDAFRVGGAWRVKESALEVYAKRPPMERNKARENTQYPTRNAE